MGYNYRISKLLKKDFILINLKNQKELADIYGDKEGFIYAGDVFGEELYNFGDSLNLKDIDKIYENSLNFFSKDETQEYFEENNPKVLTKETLAIIINIYKDRVLNYYKKMSEECTSDKQDYFINKIDLWSSNLIIDTKNKSKNLVDSGYYEYDIFQMMFIYKTFDFENNCLIFHGR